MSQETQIKYDQWDDRPWMVRLPFLTMCALALTAIPGYFAFRNSQEALGEREGLIRVEKFLEENDFPFSNSAKVYDGYLNKFERESIEAGLWWMVTLLAFTFLTKLAKNASDGAREVLWDKVQVK